MSRSLGRVDRGRDAADELSRALAFVAVIAGIAAIQAVIVLGRGLLGASLVVTLACTAFGGIAGGVAAMQARRMRRGRPDHHALTRARRLLTRADVVVTLALLVAALLVVRAGVRGPSRASG